MDVADLGAVDEHGERCWHRPLHGTDPELPARVRSHELVGLLAALERDGLAALSDLVDRA